jgi:hypothetical protein
MPTLQYVKPTEEQLKDMQIFRDKYEQLYKDLLAFEETYKGRGFSLALTKLEESAMWLNKSITKND